MTAIVGVLNKRAVAIAADSAVTLGNTHKVLNSGNKIFRLSKYAPVGIATYGTASLMGNPWEVVIKQYRRVLKETKFPKFKDYVSDFLQFLRNNAFFSSNENQKNYLQIQMQYFYDINVRLSQKRSIFPTDNHQALLDELNECKVANQASTNIVEDFRTYPLTDFKNYAQDAITKLAAEIPFLSDPVDANTFVESYFYYMRLDNLERNLESGLVFVGYGEDELYPSMQEVVITFGFDKKLQHRYGEYTEISNDGTSASITPFAQYDVAQTVIRGVNPSFYEVMSQAFDESMKDFKKQIADVIRTQPAMTALADSIESLNTARITQSYINTARTKFKELYTKPLVQTITNLGITDMTNLAESFVSLTSLVRRMTPKEETVGGPVDVAVITKGDGFIWIKRKHYFDPNLNKHFFDNYYDN